LDVLLFFECPCELSFEAFLVSRLDALANELVQCPLDTLTEVGDRFRREQILLDGGKELFFEAGCGSVEAYRLTARPGSKSPVRPGVWKCRACRKQFTVTVGTIFEDSHIPLNKWLHAIHELCASKKGKSAHQLHRTLGVTYKTAWFLCHRVREAMRELNASQLSGIIEIDETWVGGKQRGGGKGHWHHTNKTAVVGAVERDGKIRLQVIHARTKRVLQGWIRKNVADETEAIYTDEWPPYAGIGDDDTRHETVNHRAKEWVRGLVHTNSVESIWSLLKRCIIGAFHKVSVKHLERYLDELEFRFNNRHNQHAFRDIMKRLLSKEALRYEKLTA